MLPDWTILIIGPLAGIVYYLVMAWVFNMWPFHKKPEVANVSEPTEREKELPARIWEIVESCKSSSDDKQYDEAVKLIHDYAAEVRAALQDEHEHAKAEAYLNGREFERARWEAAAREAVEYFGMFKESAVKCGCPECKQARALMDKFAALLKDNKNMNNPEHAIPERGNV